MRVEDNESLGCCKCAGLVPGPSSWLQDRKIFGNKRVSQEHPRKDDPEKLTGRMKSKYV